MIKYFGGELTFREFLQIVLPCDDPDLRAAASQIESDPYCPMTESTLELLASLFYKEATFHNELNVRKRSLETCFDYTIKKAYSQIDDCSIGYVEAKSVKRFLKQAGVKFSKILKHINAIMRRIDTAGDGKLNFKTVERFLKSEP